MSKIEEPPGLEGCPPGMAPVDGFCMDRWEAHLMDIDTGQQVSPFFHPIASQVRAASAPGGRSSGLREPDAGAGGAMAGKRLCTNVEWIGACSLTEYSELQTSCNVDRDVHPVIDYFESSEAWVWSQLDHPCLTQITGTLSPAGDHDTSSQQTVFSTWLAT